MFDNVQYYFGWGENTCKKETSCAVTETWPENWFCAWKATPWVGCFLSDPGIFIFSRHVVDV